MFEGEKQGSVRPLTEEEKRALRRNIAFRKAAGVDILMTAVQAESVKAAMGIDVRDFGITVQDTPPADARLVCRPAKEPVDPRLIEAWGAPSKGNCDNCGQEVWLDHRSPAGIPKICHDCHQAEEKLRSQPVEGVH